MRAPRRLGCLLGCVALLASACGDEGVDPPSATASELSQHEGEFCPETMPRAAQETYGFGTSDPAESKPSLSKPDEAWLCAYGSSDVAPPGANGAWLEWVRQGEPRELDDAELAAFAAALDELAPPTGQEACTDDLGPRYLVSYTNEDDLTGVVIDDYGCRAIRLTDDPRETVPGEASGAGTVAGVLYGPAGLLDDLHARQGPDDDGVALYEPYGEGSDAALLEGRLELAPGCVYVVDPGSDQRHLPVFPADEVQRDEDVLTYGDITFEDGDQISLGGGAPGGTWAPEADGHSVPDGCDLTVRAFIVGQDLGPG